MTTRCVELCEERQCFYCRGLLSPRHEHDHFPIPARAGGTNVVPACLNCHDLKDRQPLNGWPIDDALRAASWWCVDAPTEARLFFAKALALAADHD